MQQILVFSDLDGTLLDHHSYSFAAALPALEELRRRNIPLILNSSKTAEEILNLRKELGNAHPFVVENGGAVCIPRGYFAAGFSFGAARQAEGLEIKHFGIPYAELLGIVHAIRQEHRLDFRGFADMDGAEVAAATGLPLERAEQARARLCGEPLQWLDDEDNLPVFEAALLKKGLRLLRGGRFFHVMGQFDKADAVRYLIEAYRKALPAGSGILTIALGDSPNDLRMLQQVDIPVAVDPASGERLKLDNPRAIYPLAQGPVGWRKAMEEIFRLLNR